MFASQISKPRQEIVIRSALIDPRPHVVGKQPPDAVFHGFLGHLQLIPIRVQLLGHRHNKVIKGDRCELGYMYKV